METYIYFIQSCDEVGLMKIGISKDPEKRLASLSTGNGSKLKLKATLKCPSSMSGRDVETQLHRIFEYSWTRGEWFTSSKPLRELVNQIKDGLIWSEVIDRARALTLDKRIRYRTKQNALAKRQEAYKKLRM